MEAISTLVRVSFPSYLQNLPIPDSITGFASLSAGDWLRLVPFVGTVSLMVYVGVRAFRPPDDKCKVNPRVKKDVAKVADAVDIEDLGDKQAYCRCWRSNKFPLCDGSHNMYNTINHDNVGPLIVKRKAPSSS